MNGKPNPARTASSRSSAGNCVGAVMASALFLLSPRAEAHSWYDTACKRVEDAYRQPDFFVDQKAPQPVQEDFDL